jgi:hypothetical protein
MPAPSSATEVGATSLGAGFARAIAGRDFGRLAELLHPAVDFRALTPSRSWEPAGRDGALKVLRAWFDDFEVRDLLRLETAEIAGRYHVAYRCQGERPDGSFLIEQQAYYDVTDGRMSWIRLLCSGYRSCE